MQYLLCFDNDKAGQEATKGAVKEIEISNKWWKGIQKFYGIELSKLTETEYDNWWKKYDEEIDNIRYERLEEKMAKEFLNNFKSWKYWEDKDVRNMFNAKIRELEQEIFDESRYRNKVYMDSTVPEMEKGWVMEWSLAREDKMKKMLRRFIWLKKKDKNETLNLEQAKLFPVGELISGYKRERGGRQTFKCPLHNEKTGSFTWYKKNNSWYCFGCGKGGDVIALYMQLHEVNFIEAVKILCA